MKLQATPTAELPDVWLIQPRIFGDARGFFMESFSQRDFEFAIGQKINFVQDNHSRSQFGVLRGLHFQRSPHAQGKLVRVLRGSILDVAVDMRQKSPTFGHWTSAILNDENHHQLWIPPGFAHGFAVLSKNGADVAYKTTDYYSPTHDAGLYFADPHIGIVWPTPPEGGWILSEKDKHQPTWDTAHYF